VVGGKAIQQVARFALQHRGLCGMGGEHGLHFIAQGFVLLAQFPNSTVVISGHTDSVGTVIYNIKLGYSRAKEVSRYVHDWLYQKDVRLRNEMEIRTYGEAEPIAPNSTDEGRQRNRRVEIAIVRNQ